MFQGTVLMDDVVLFSCKDKDEKKVSAMIAKNVPDRLVFACRTVIAEVCDKCGKSTEETGECPDQCPEQQFCECGAHHDIDDNEGYVNREGKWVCSQCRNDACESDESACNDFEKVEYARKKSKWDTEATMKLAGVNHGK